MSVSRYTQTSEDAYPMGKLIKGSASKKQKPHNTKDDFKEFVVDVQGFRNNDGSFILKEIGVQSVFGDVTWHEMVESEVLWEQLSEKRKKEAEYASIFIHGIIWSDGHDKLKIAIRRVKFAILGAKVIWAKGSDKCTTVQKLLNIPVHDLEQEGCPKAQDIPFQSTYKECSYAAHGNIADEGPAYRCALMQSQKYAAWLKNHQMKHEESYDSDTDSDNYEIEKYCCIHKCFGIPANRDEVDGQACEKCESFCMCYCKCQTYMKTRLYNLKQKLALVKEVVNSYGS